MENYRQVCRGYCKAEGVYCLTRNHHPAPRIGEKDHRMAFQSGRITYTRFQYSGEGPAVCDDNLLDTLKEHRFRETEIGAPNEVEVGWVTGEHLFDTQFSFEKNNFGRMVLLAMRFDTHKVPPAIKQAYKTMNTTALAAENPSGFASKAQKREAAELAGRQMQEDLAAGKFRKSKMVPVLWDLASQTVYAGGAGNTVSEKLVSLFYQAFDLTLEPVSAGPLAARLMADKPHRDALETLRPSAFTGPPAKATADYESADGRRDLSEPVVPWVAKAGDMKDFLGNEWALWLWHRLETAEGVVPITLPDGETEAFIAIDKTLDMDCAWDADGKQTLRGGAPTRMNEAAAALSAGKWPRKLGLIVSDGQHQWELTLQADRMIVSSALLPEIHEVEHPHDLVEARLQLTTALSDTLDALYAAFLAERTSQRWDTIRQHMRQWITARRKPVAPAPQVREPVSVVTEVTTPQEVTT